MPIDPSDLEPGKRISINGKTFFTPPLAPSYNGTLNTYAGGNPNTTEQFRVFGMMGSERLTQNKTLFYQDTWDLKYKNTDLPHGIRARYRPITYEDTYDQINPAEQRNYRKPIRTKRYNGGNT